MGIIWSGQLEQNQWNLIKFEQASTAKASKSGFCIDSINPYYQYTTRQ